MVYETRKEYKGDQQRDYNGYKKLTNIMDSKRDSYNFAVWDIEESRRLRHCVSCKEAKCNWEHPCSKCLETGNPGKCVCATEADKISYLDYLHKPMKFLDPKTTEQELLMNSQWSGIG